MTRAKPYPSDPSMRESRVTDSPALPVTGPEKAPGGDPGQNSPRSREEGLGVKPAVVEANLEALAEWDAAVQAQADAAEAAELERMAEASAKKAPAKKAAAAKKAPAKAAAKKSTPAKKAPPKKAAR